MCAYSLYLGAVAWSKEQIRFSEGTSPSVIGMVNCSGDEVEILDCHHIVSPPCGRFSDAGVICQGKEGFNTIVIIRYYNIMLNCLFNLEAGLEVGNCSEGSLRLTGGYGLVGRLEICINNAWGTICHTQFKLSELEVACAQLGGTGTALINLILHIYDP